MLPFPHVWRTDPKSGLVRCYRAAKPGEAKDLAESLAGRLRAAVQHTAVASVMLGAAQVRLHGWGEVEAGGVADLLRRAERECSAHVSYLAVIEAELGELLAKWDGPEPADYAAARDAARARIKRHFPHADPRLLEDC